MSEVAKFSAVHMLRDGRQVEIRAIRSEDGTASSRPSAAPATTPSAAASLRLGATLAINNSNSFHMSILPAASL